MDNLLFNTFSKWIDVSKIDSEPKKKKFYFFLVSIKTDYYSKQNIEIYLARLKDTAISIDGILGSLILLHIESSVSNDDIILLRDPNVRFIYFEKTCVYDNVGPAWKMLYTPVFSFPDNALRTLSELRYGESKMVEKL
ncbi:MAG: hypothetical protein J5965_07020 [Aeriscardovia sp.]|nr:hypothetical protein [Aeriscardovia sp.]MBP3283557.1 hypothetical protein [Treponema sp.]